jgi:hypothetical protein
MAKKTRTFRGRKYTRTLFEDVDWFGIRKSAEYSGRKYRIIPSKRDRGWWLYVGPKKRKK